MNKTPVHPQKIVPDLNIYRAKRRSRLQMSSTGKTLSMS